MTNGYIVRPYAATARACLTALALTLPALTSSQAEERQDVRALMQGAQSSLRTLLIQSAKPEGLRSPDGADKAIEAIGELYDAGTSLQLHMSGAESRYLAEILSYQAWWMGLAFNLEQMGVVEALSREMTNVCVACHTRLPDVRETAGAEAFLPENKLNLLGTIQRAQLEIATRRFEPALARLEEYALTPDVAWPEVERAAVLHMTVSIRVRGDLAAPRRLVAELATRSPLTVEASQTIAAWTESLQHVSLDVSAPELLPTARGLVNIAGGQATGSLRNRRKLIELLVASTMLNELLAEHATPPAETAEASYLLGLSYSRVGNMSHASLASFHLERAVKMTPKAPWAPASLKELEATLLELYGAESRDELPEDALQDFEALETLVRS